MEKMTVVTVNQDIEIDNLEGILFTDSFHAASTNGKILVKVIVILQLCMTFGL